MQTTKQTQKHTCQGAIMNALQAHGGVMLMTALVSTVTRDFAESYVYSSMRMMQARMMIERCTIGGKKAMRICEGIE